MSDHRVCNISILLEYDLQGIYGTRGADNSF